MRVARNWFASISDCPRAARFSALGPRGFYAKKRWSAWPNQCMRSLPGPWIRLTHRSLERSAPTSSKSAPHRQFFTCKERLSRNVECRCPDRPASCGTCRQHTCSLVEREIVPVESVYNSFNGYVNIAHDGVFDAVPRREVAVCYRVRP